MKCIKIQVDELNDKIDDVELKIFKLIKDIDYLDALKEKFRKKKIKLLKSF